MDWIDLLEGATRRFAAVLETEPLDAAVPTCPGWTLADLGEHLRVTHAWAAHAVTHGDPDGEPPPGPLDRDRLTAGYRAAARHLVEVLAARPADAPAWTFGPEPRTAGFWRRRQVHETTMHLYDALASADRADEWQIPPALAWDGVTEVGSVFYPRQVRLGRIAPLGGTLRLVPTDLHPAPVEIGSGEPVAEVTGPASYLLQVLWKRAPVEDPVATKLLSTAITP